MSFQAAFYIGTPPGLSGIYNRGIRFWCASPYSHVELIFSGNTMGSSSYMDGGVRLKAARPTPGKWVLVDLDPALEPAARAWFDRHDGQPYDLLGHLHFIASPIRLGQDAWFCSEAVAAALGLPEPWRYDPALLASSIQFITQPASAGFSIPDQKGLPHG